MNGEAAAHFIAGFASRWAGVNPDDLRAGQRPILERFGSNVMLAWELMADELRKLEEEKAQKKAAKA